MKPLDQIDLCKCGHVRAEHAGLEGHGACTQTLCECEQFTWAGFTEPPGPPRRIIIVVEGGVIQNIENIPQGVDVEVRDYDTDGWDPFDEEDGERFKEDDAGEHYIESVYVGRE